MHFNRGKAPCILIVAIILAGFTLISACQPIYKKRLPLFSDEVKKAVSPQELQNWAIDTLSKSSSEAIELPINKIPKELRELTFDGSPLQSAYFSVNDESKIRFIKLVWGSGFAHWGIDIGNPTLTISDQEAFLIPWIPGIYFWHETH